MRNGPLAKKDRDDDPRARARCPAGAGRGRIDARGRCRYSRGDIGIQGLVVTGMEWQALQLSLAVALRSVAFSLPFAIGVAWLLARRRFPGRALLDALVHLPLVLPPVAVGYLLLVLFGNHGWIGAWLHEHLGVQLAFTRSGAALATAVMAFPLMVRTIRVSFEHLDGGLEEAARSLGAGPVDCLFHVTLPLLLPGILAGAVTAFVAALGEFGAVITFASNVPGETQTLPLALYTALQTPGGDAAAARLALVAFAVGMAGLLVSERILRGSRPPAGR